MLGSGVFITLYFLLLQNTVIHQQKRFYLLFSLIGSLVLPFLNFPLITSSASVVQYIQSEKGVAILHQLPIIVRSSNTADQEIDFIGIMNFSFLLISIILLFRFFFGIVKLFILIRTRGKVNSSYGKVVLIDRDITPFSFMGYIFVSKEAYENKRIEKEIFIHERAHNIQRHSVDILIVELLHCLFWFNPFLFLYKKAIKLNHEYLADEAVLVQTNEADRYMGLLLSNTYSVNTSYLTSSIYFINLKKRFIMITKSKRKAVAKFRLFAAILCMASFAVTISATAQVMAEVNSNNNEIPSGPGATPQELKLYDVMLKRMSSLDTAFDGKIIDNLDLSKGSQDTLGMLFRKMNAEQRKERVEKTNVNFTENILESTHRFTKTPYGPGATAEELIEYDQVISKMLHSFVGKNGKTYNGVDMSKGNIDRLAVIYEKMNEEQRTERIKKTGISIDKATKHKSVRPIASQLSEWADSKKYGVWVDAKRVSNGSLKNYKPNDFGDYDVSKLSKNAINYGKHYFQVSLFTNEEVASWQPPKNKFVFLTRADQL